MRIRWYLEDRASNSAHQGAREAIQQIADAIKTVPYQPTWNGFTCGVDPHGTYVESEYYHKTDPWSLRAILASIALVTIEESGPQIGAALGYYEKGQATGIVDSFEQNQWLCVRVRVTARNLESALTLYKEIRAGATPREPWKTRDVLYTRLLTEDELGEEEEE